jgi:hypothetical protein
MFALKWLSIVLCATRGLDRRLLYAGPFQSLRPSVAKMKWTPPTKYVTNLERVMLGHMIVTQHTSYLEPIGTFPGGSQTRSLVILPFQRPYPLPSITLPFPWLAVPSRCLRKGTGNSQFEYLCLL